MCSNYPGIKLEPALGTWEDKLQHLSSYAHVVHTTAKQVISRRRKNENVYNMSKNEKCTCKACKNTVFHCQICKFMGFSFPLSSGLLKLPNGGQPNTAVPTKQCNPSYSDMKWIVDFPSKVMLLKWTSVACTLSTSKQILQSFNDDISAHAHGTSLVLFVAWWISFCSCH